MAPSPHLVGDLHLSGKVCLVTGGGSGISLAFCKLARSQGARVIIADLKLIPEAQTFVDSDPKNRYNDVPDVVIGGAGIFEPPSGNFWEDPETERYLSIDVNVGHVIRITRLAIRALAGRGKKGVVCSIASAAGLQGYYGTPLYCATKFAVVGLTRSLAPAERLEGVKVCCICPGATDTPLWLQQTILSKAIPDDAFLKVDRIAEIILDLVTSSRYTGGTVLQIAAGKDPRITPTWNIEPPEYSAKAFDEMMGGDSADVHPLFKGPHEAVEQDRAQRWP